MDKKVIEQGVSFLDITHLTKTISIYEKFHSRPEGKTILVDKSKATEVAKAICPKYQELEDENKILKNQIESIFKNANDKVESLEQSNAKLLEALDDAESVIETIYKECSPHESAWHLANEFILKRQAIQQSESKSKDNE